MAYQAGNLDLFHRFFESSGSFSLTSALVLILVSLVSYVRLHKPRPPAIQFYGEDVSDPEAPKKRWMSDSINLLEEGYKKFEGCFQVWTTEGPQVVVPPKFFDELRQKPETAIRSSLLDSLQGQYTMPAARGHNLLSTRIVKLELNKHISRLFPLLKKELDHAISTELPVGDDWMPIKFHPQVVRIISRITGRVFVGPELNRNEEWIQTSCNFTTCAFQGALKLRTYHPWLRPIAIYFVPEITNLRKLNAVARKYIIPIIKRREFAEKCEGYEKPNDSIEWVRDSLPANAKGDFEYQSNIQLCFGAVSIHTTSQMVTNIIYDLCAHPEYVEMLKEEVKMVLSEHGGVYSAESMNDLKKLDSFMKESQRIGGASSASWARKVLKPVTLSDGTYLPSNTFLFAPSLAVSSDPLLYSCPETFNGLRFYEMRQQSPAEANKHLFTSTSSTELHFGGGRHACPGRFFAGHEIKMIVATLLREFEFRFREGEGRPKAVLFQMQNMPDPTGVIEFRKVTV